MTPRFARAAGVLLLVVPFLPLVQIFGDLDGAGALLSPGEWLLGVAVFGTIAWLIALAAGAKIWSLGEAIDALGRPPQTAILAGGMLALAALLLATSLVAFGATPLHVDSVAQLFQAKIFATGVLAAPLPHEPEFVVTQNMVIGSSGWYSQYPPGHAALLSLGVLAGWPFAVPLLLSLGSAVFLFLFTRLAYGDDCARLVVPLLVVCPFFWFMGASYMNHVSTLFFLSLFLYLFVYWEGAPSWGRALAAGSSLGAVVLIRPLVALAVGSVFSAIAWTASVRSGEGFRRRAFHLLAAGLGFAGVSAVYLLYNWGVTGDPFLPGYLQLWGGSHGLGFHTTPWGGEHTPWTGLRNELLDLSLLNLFLFEWPIPALLPVGLALAAGWMEGEWDGRLLFGFLAVPAAYFFYWHRDAFLGPRFLFASVAFLVPLTARSLMAFGRRVEGTKLQLGSLFRPVRGGRLALAFIGLCVLYAVIVGIPGRFRSYKASRLGMKIDLRERAARAGIEAGLIFVKVSWGNRILARLRGRGVPATTAIRAYRGVGHCELYELLETASRRGWRSDRLVQEVRRRTAVAPLVRRPELNGDPTLRLRRGRSLTHRCREAVRYDRGGYTNYTPHLTANRPTLDGELVIVRDLAQKNRWLARRYPGRPMYRFDGEELVPIESGAVPSGSGS